MRLTISFLVVLSLSLLGLPGLTPGSATMAWAAPAPPTAHAVQARKKKRASRPKKVKAAKKTEDPKKKKNDRGFEL
jgi:hypothetical protein